jgi:hypothetical protein
MHLTAAEVRPEQVLDPVHPYAVLPEPLVAATLPMRVAQQPYGEPVPYS